MGQTREVAVSRTPEGQGSAWEAAAWENQGNKLRGNALVPQVPSGSVWTPPTPNPAWRLPRSRSLQPGRPHATSIKV